MLGCSTCSTVNMQRLTQVSVSQSVRRCSGDELMWNGNNSKNLVSRRSSWCDSTSVGEQYVSYHNSWLNDSGKYWWRNGQVGGQKLRRWFENCLTEVDDDDEGGGAGAGGHDKHDRTLWPRTTRADMPEAWAKKLNLKNRRLKFEIYPLDWNSLELYTTRTLLMNGRNGALPPLNF